MTLDLPQTVGTLTTRVGVANGAPEVDAHLFIPTRQPQ